MNLKTLIPFLILIFIIGCKSEEKEPNGFEINGEIDVDYSDIIYLSYGEKEDSTYVIENKFYFKGIMTEPDDALLRLKNAGNPGGTLFIENSNIDIKVSIFKMVFENKEYNNIICISVICHNPVIPAITSLSNIRSPKYLRFNL